jgi:hypothetical protein
MKDTLSEPNVLYDNDGEGRFTQPYPMGFPGDTVTSFATAVGDFDRAGRYDIVVSNQNPYPAMLWQNETPSGRHLLVDVQGVSTNRDGVGAWIEAFVDGAVYTRYTLCGEAYLAQNSATQHIGLGNAERVDSLRVTWLGGGTDVLLDVTTDEHIRLLEHSTQGLSSHWQYLDVQVEGQVARLNWALDGGATAQKFIIQRSTDRLRYETVGERPSNSSNDFLFSDEGLERHRSYYYRVIIVGEDGRWIFSPSVLVHITPSGISLGELFPNPSVSGSVHFPYYAEMGEDIRLLIYSSNGQLIRETDYPLQAGEGRIYLDLAELRTGLYYIRIPYGGFSITRKVIVE